MLCTLDRRVDRIKFGVLLLDQFLNFERLSDGPERQKATPMVCDDNLLSGGTVTPFLVTAGLTRQSKVMLLQDPNDLIGG